MSAPGPKKIVDSPLVAAARALEAELSRFVKLADDAQRVALTSHKNLRRGGQALAEAVACEEGLSQYAQALNAAIAAARDAHQAHAESVQARGQELQLRQRDYDALVTL